MRDTILVLTNSSEDAVELITRHIREVGQSVFRINTDQLFGEHIALELSGEQSYGSITFEGERLDLDRVRSVWDRRPTPPVLPESISKESAEFVVGEYRSFLWSLCTILEVFWINPPLVATRLLEHNKPKQRLDAVRVGLRVPATLITNDPQRILEFCRRHGGKVVVKSIRPTLVRQEGERGQLFVFTTPISAEDIIGREAEIRLAPVMLQEYVEKALEFRVTIIGGRIFTCAIHSQDSERTRHDWRRYDFEKVKHEVYQLPVEVEQKLLALMKEWGLVYGAMDMILTPSGEYVFLEVNPTGQWGWIEYLTGMPISRTIAELLMNPTSTR